MLVCYLQGEKIIYKDMHLFKSTMESFCIIGLFLLMNYTTAFKGKLI